MIAVLLYRCLPWLMGLAHPYYVSVTEVEYDARSRSMGVSCKMFTDDIEEALKKSSGAAVRLSEGDKARNTALLDGYLRRHLRIAMGGKAVALAFLGYEFEDGAVICYLESGDLRPARQVDVECDLLYELREQQVNILHVTVNHNRTSRRLVNPASRWSIPLK